MVPLAVMIELTSKVPMVVMIELTSKVPMVVMIELTSTTALVEMTPLIVPVSAVPCFPRRSASYFNLWFGRFRFALVSVIIGRF